MKVIGITGATGSGKSFLAKRLFDELNNEAVIFDQDNYFYFEDNQPLDKNGQPNFDTPHSLNLNKFEDDFFRLIKGEKVIQEIYSYNKPRKSAEVQKIYEPKQFIIIEGIFALYNENVLNNCDLTIFVEADLEKTIERRIYRDSQERGYDKDDVMYKFENHIIDSYNNYILPLKAQVDLIFNNIDNDFNNLDSFIAQVMQKIRE